MLGYYKKRMGFFTGYSEIIGNPTDIRLPKRLKRLEGQFSWQGRVRAVLKSGNVTPIGYYDGYGRIEVGNNKYNLDEKVGRGVGSGDAFMITDYVYQKIIDHKKYYSEMNLYTMLLNNSRFTDRETKILGYKDELIELSVFRLNPNRSKIIFGEDDWYYTDPRRETDKGKKSKERIERLVNEFMDRNSIKNSNNNSRIKWEKKFVKNMPTNEVGSLNNFKDGNKVIQYKVGNINKYVSQYTFIQMAKMSPNIAYNKPENRILFKNPFTRANVKRGEIKFMVLKNAATKIQSVVRGKKARNVVQERKTAARRKLLANATAKRK